MDTSPRHQVNIGEAKRQWWELLERVERGEQIVIARAGRPVAVLGPAPNEEPNAATRG